MLERRVTGLGLKRFVDAPTGDLLGLLREPGAKDPREVRLVRFGPGIGK